MKNIKKFLSSITRNNRGFRYDYRILKATELFDPLYYLNKNNDVLAKGINPFRHYESHGRHEGRHPTLKAEISATFDAEYYLNTYKDIAASGSNPLEHYFAFGIKEGRYPNAAQEALSDGFDAAYYLKSNPDVANSGADPLRHYVAHGYSEGRFPNKSTELREFPIQLKDLCCPTKDEIGPRISDKSFLVSVITPTYNTKPLYLRELYQTLANQTYENWEWIVVDDGSQDATTITTLRELATKDARIKLILSMVNQGISGASNKALAAATGTHAALVDHDDLVSRDAFLQIYKSYQYFPDTDIFYTDECKLSEDGILNNFWAKPSWSPSYLENTMSIGHLTTYRMAFLQKLGGFRSEFDGTQDFDLALRASLLNPQVKHLPFFAYIWRISPGSAALNLDEKSYAVERQQRALLDYATQRNSKATVEPGWQTGWWRIRYPLPAVVPLLSYIIPTGGKSRLIREESVDLIINCIRSLKEKDFYPNSEYIVIHNGDLSVEQIEWLKNIDRLQLIEYKSNIFNFSEKLNLGVSHASGEYLCLLNDDVEVITHQGGCELVSYLMNTPWVGAIGPHCLFEDGTTQQNGVMLVRIGPVHTGEQTNRNISSTLGMLRCRREVFCIGGAIMIVDKELFSSVGGFSEDLVLNYNDIDFGLKLRKKGYSSVVDPGIKAFHFESATKVGTSRVEQELLFIKHPDISDPYFSVWFDQNDPNYKLDLTRSSDATMPFGAWLDRHIACRAVIFEPVGQYKLSICVPIYNQPEKFLEDMLKSVLLQTYHNWELLIYDDGSTDHGTIHWLSQLPTDDRINLFRSEHNFGISAANRKLLETATGDFILLLDADDFLCVDALRVMASAIEQNPSKKIFYSDEYKSDINSARFSPFIKPDFDPILLVNCCYPTHLMAINTEFQRQIGSYTDDRATWCHDYDTLTRALGVGEEPVHVRELTYAWRISPGSTASADTGTKPGTIASQRFVLERMIAAKGLSKKLYIEPNTLGSSSGMWRLRSREPVTDVIVVSATKAWGPSGLEVDGLLSTTLNSGADWIAIMVEPDNADQLLELSAIAIFEPRIDAVAGILLRDDENTVAWSGGLFLPKGRLLDPYAAQAFTSGGYHAQLWCQRCIDVPAPVNVLIRADALRRAVGRLGKSADADGLMTMLGLGAHESDRMIAVTPHVRAVAPPASLVSLPMDRVGRLANEDALTRGSRWYDDRLSVEHPYTLPGVL